MADTARSDRGRRLLRLAEEAGALAADFPLDDITYEIPVPSPEKIICVGVNYPGPQRGVQGRAGRAVQPVAVHPLPALLRRPWRAADAAAGIPTARLRGRNRHRHRQGLADALPRADALDHIAALSLCNEGTIRDWVRHAKFNVTQGKNFDRSGSIGPWLVPFTDEAQIADIGLTTRVMARCASRTAPAA